MEIAEVVMNPIRQRIFQYFLLHETGTVKELKKALSDIPNASLYRHIKILVDHSILIVVGENRIRGPGHGGRERKCRADVPAQYLRLVCKILCRR